MLKILGTPSLVSGLLLCLLASSGEAVEPVGEPVELAPIVVHTAIGGNGKGLVVSAWCVGDDLFLQRLRGGVAVGPVQEIETIGGTPLWIDMAVAPDGGVTLASFEQVCPACGVPPSAPNTSLYRLAPDGSFLESPRTLVPDSSSLFRVDVDAAGGIALLGPETVDATFDLFLHLQDSSGAPMGDPIPVGVLEDRSPATWDIAKGVDGSSLVIWTEVVCDPLDCTSPDRVYGGLWGRIFDPEGSPTTPVLTLAERAMGASATALPAGGFAIAWNVPEDVSFNAETALAVYTRIVSSQAVGPVLAIKEPATGVTNGRAPGSRPLVVVDARGNGLVTWQEQQPADAGDLSFRLLAQGWDLVAGAEGPQLLLSPASEAWQLGSGVAAGKPGEFLAGWAELRDFSQPVVVQALQVEADGRSLSPDSL